MWTPPHFWALSLFRSDDYARAGVPMLPVVQRQAVHPPPDSRSTRWSWCRSACCRPSSAWAARSISSASAGTGRLVAVEAFAVLRETDEAQGARGAAAVRRVARSICLLLFAALIVEHLVGFRRCMALDVRRWTMQRSATRANGASAISRWRWCWSALVILFYRDVDRAGGTTIRRIEGAVHGAWRSEARLSSGRSRARGRSSARIGAFTMLLGAVFWMNKDYTASSACR